MSDAELMNEIARLAGAINRHKNGTTSGARTTHQSSGVTKYGHNNAFHHRGRGSLSRPYRGRGGGSYRGGFHQQQPPFSSKVTNDGVNYREVGSKLESFDGAVRNDNVAKAPAKKPCPHFTRTGTCSRGLSCPYSHDNSHVAICKHYLTGKCNRPDCSLSHTPSPHNSPMCQFYAKGNCTNRDCRYTHSKKLTGKVCKDFAVDGYCELGIDCPDRHVFECPEFDATGQCSHRGCKLKHVFRNDSHFTHDTKDTEHKNSLEEGGKINVAQLALDINETSEDEDYKGSEESDSEGSSSSDEEDGEEKDHSIVEFDTKARDDDSEIGQQDFIEFS